MSRRSTRLKSPRMECLRAAAAARELERVLIGETDDAAMEDSGRECVAGADAVDDAVERVRTGYELALAGEHHTAEPLAVHAVDVANRGANRLEARERRERSGSRVPAPLERLAVELDAKRQRDVAIVDECDLRGREHGTQETRRIAA